MNVKPPAPMRGPLCEDRWVFHGFGKGLRHTDESYWESLFCVEAGHRQHLLHPAFLNLTQPWNASSLISEHLKISCRTLGNKIISEIPSGSNVLVGSNFKFLKNYLQCLFRAELPLLFLSLDLNSHTLGKAGLLPGPEGRQTLSRSGRWKSQRPAQCFLPSLKSIHGCLCLRLSSQK